MKFRIRNRTRLWINLIVSGAFIALAIYGWELPVETAVIFLVICVVSLAVIIGLGVLAGWVLRRLRQDSDP